MQSHHIGVPWLLSLSILICVSTTQSACGAQFSTTYQSFSPLHGGYDETEEKDEGENVYLVAYYGGRPGLAERGAAYRCAEFAYEKGYRYFVVLAGNDYSGRVHGGVGAGGVTSSVHVGDVRYKIRLSKTKVEGENAFDAYDVLDHVPVPNTEHVYSVEERQQSEAGRRKPESQ